jgi:4-carboxymuconolactone decarboxylase
MERFSALSIAQMSDAQREVYAQIASGPRGVVQGPLLVWLHNPELARHAQALGAYCRYSTSLPPRLSELAILVTGAHWQAAFEWTIHAPIGLAAGLSRELVESLRCNERPAAMSEEENVVYDFATELLKTRRVSDSTFAIAREQLGSEGVVDLVGLLGYYGLISMTLNAFEVAESDGRDNPFSDRALKP